MAHVGHFRAEYVGRRRWLDEQTFSELVAVTNLLPGPSSSQLGIAIGALRSGKLGALAAWLGFTLPSATAMTALALGVGASDVAGAGWVHGLELVAVPVVALAVVGLWRSLALGATRSALAVAALGLALGLEGFAGQAAALGLGALAGLALLRAPAEPPQAPATFGRHRLLAPTSFAILALLLAGLPAAADATGTHALDLSGSMARSGALVFGGGHVVLPLLHEAVVEPGWVPEEEFLAGYGLVQAMPGPLFTFSAYLGAIEEPAPNGVAGAALALGAVFAPSFLLLAGVLPLWAAIRTRQHIQVALAGVGAAVVGVLAAAFWDPVLTTSMDGVGDAAFALGLLGALRVVPVWVVVPLAAIAGEVAF